MSRKQKPIGQEIDLVTIKGLYCQWTTRHAEAADKKGLGVTAIREIKRAQKLLDEAYVLSAKAMGRQRHGNDA